MKEFPSILNIKFKHRFPELHYNRVLCYLRKAIYEHVIREDENSYFDLEKFCLQYFKREETESMIEKLAKTVISELENLGWKCKLSFGETGLFIYSTDKPPPSCWDDGLH